MLLEHGWKSLYSSGFRHPFFFGIMADECTDFTTIEDLTICCRWVESGVPEEHFIEILPLKKANAESIYSALVEYCREKNIQLGRLIGMGFDGTATFSGDKTRESWKSSHFMHCLSTATVLSFNWLLCKLLMLHQVSSSLRYPDDVMEVLSLLPKTCRVIKGDSESTRSSRAQDCLHYSDDVMEVLSLPPKTCRVIKGDSESTRSSTA